MSGLYYDGVKKNICNRIPHAIIYILYNTCFIIKFRQFDFTSPFSCGRAGRNFCFYIRVSQVTLAHLVPTEIVTLPLNHCNQRPEHRAGKIHYNIDCFCSIPDIFLSLYKWLILIIGKHY